MKARPWRHLYNRAAWKRLRLAQLAKHPLCWTCASIGKTTPADVVDHHIPHKGSERLFFDAGNLRSMCKTCHDSVKQKQEKTGIMLGSNDQGMPLDENHHWNT